MMLSNESSRFTVRPSIFSWGSLNTCFIEIWKELSIRMPTPLEFLVELQYNWYCLLLFVRNSFLIFSHCSEVPHGRKSLRKIKLVHSEVIAMIFDNCLSYSVEILRELQF